MSPMTLNPCINLSFDGQCEAAFKFYERCLNGKITFMLTWGDSPMAADMPQNGVAKLFTPRWSSAILDCRDPIPLQAHMSRQGASTSRSTQVKAMQNVCLLS